ncbi:hypothetical protein EGW08_010789 [Elysia chlorotica]|uniref:EGF-like domain-containing protein n=1 Tax=Elysia chlorotica TaxID=188477 RepID=A0A3S1BDH0_ELYCH|nr:hypothetical protein EGW08_010789 [Elysia chlorotica]
MFFLSRFYFSYLQVSSSILSQDCLPSLPCAGDCFESSISDFERRFCNQTSSSDTSIKHCECTPKTCRRLQQHCLIICKNQSMETLKDCISCLSSFKKPLITNSVENTEPICAEHCNGICLDTRCSETENCYMCALGYKGESCMETCSPNCLDGCHAESGSCLNCPKGRYGPECEFTCPQNCLDGKCLRANGSCEACATGYRGEYCNEKCPQGFYGNACDSQCSKTCEKGYCVHTNGHCLDGCKPGYFGLTCKLKCPPQMYGQGCLSYCPATCAEGSPCNHETGECVSGCLSGFRGPFCNTTCPESKYGANCYFNCSQDCFHRLCNAISGTCLACEDSSYGSLCQYKINVDGIHHRALESELTNFEAVLLIGGIILTGVLMWIAVAYLLLHQRKRILKEAAKGIDPRTSQWGMFPNNRAFQRAVKLYDQNLAYIGGGDAVAVTQTKIRKGKTKQPNVKNKRRKIDFRISKKLWWWTYPRGEKLKPPDEEEIERVAKWLAQHHGGKHSSRDSGSKGTEIEGFYFKNETGEITEESHSNDAKNSVNNGSHHSFKQEITTKTSAEVSTEISTIQEQQENLQLPTETPTGQEEVNLTIGTQQSVETTSLKSQSQQSQCEVSQTNDGQYLHQDQSKLAIGVSFSNELVGNDKLPIRSDTIYLHPEPSKSPNIKEPECLKDTSRVRWFRNKIYSPNGNKKPGAASSKEKTSSTYTSSATVSRSYSSTSTSSYTSSGSSTMSDTNTSRWRNQDESDYTTSDVTTSSSSSEDEMGTLEGSSLSTLATRQKDQSFIGDKPTCYATGSRAIAKPAMKTTEVNTTSDELETPGILQKIYGVFSRKKKNPEQGKPNLSLQNTNSIPGAGGLPRPFSNKFLINRLETWTRNRGLEVNINDGVMEVASSKNQRMSRSPWRAGFSKRTKGRKVRQDYASSWITTDQSDKGDRCYSTSKQSMSTSVEELTDVPSALVADTVREETGIVKHGHKAA